MKKKNDRITHFVTSDMAETMGALVGIIITQHDSNKLSNEQHRELRRKN